VFYGSGTIVGIASKQVVDAAARALNRWQHFSAWNAITAAVLKLQCHIKNVTLSIDMYLLQEQFCQILPSSNLKSRSLMSFWRGHHNKNNNMN